MSVSGGIITAPIYAEDPYNLLGVPKQPSGYDVGYVGSNKHGMINPYSKYKPVIYNSLFTVKDYWYRSSKAGYLNGKQPCGVSVNLLEKDAGKINYNNIENKIIWKNSYNPPNGGSTSPYRLTDFNGYNHNARIPFDCSFPKDDIIYIGDAFTGDSLKCFFDGDFSPNPLSSNNICALDIEYAFQNSIPNDTYGIVGFLAYADYQFFIKTINVNSNNPIPLVNINASEDKEGRFYTFATRSTTTKFYPIFCNKVIPLWTDILDLSDIGLEIIMFPAESSNYKIVKRVRKFEKPITVDYIVRAFKYNSNFQQAFSPLENAITYNGNGSKLDFEMEIICFSDAVSGGNIIPSVGYEYTSIAGRKVVTQGDYVDKSGGHWATVDYNGKTYKSYRWSRYTIKDMYLDSNGFPIHNTGSISVKWIEPKYRVEGSFYMFLY